ncbi:hypothetical protein BJX61DRAFT_54899 [Aspergillus egyptiacus]|nr:hypothetical protein BJX61DRAFT_54899 [Aspergillus egyptiacus]
MATRRCYPTILTTLANTASVKLRLSLSRCSKASFSSVTSTKSRHGPRIKLPPKSWDSHMHVMEPQYPVVADAAYKPTTPHSIDEGMTFESSLGIENVVLIQPSIYGFDNSCLLDALQRIGPSRGRGVVVIDPANTDKTALDKWHSLGVRGVRVNFKSAGQVPSRNELERILSDHARLIRPLSWGIQIHTAMETIPLLEGIVPQLGLKVCIDHFGGPDLTNVIYRRETFDPYTLPGFSSLIALLKGGRTYVKISAPYRLSKDDGLRDLEVMMREFLRHAPERVLYATDWPHTRFSNVNIEPFTALCLRACGTKALAERVFRLNAEELMGSAHCPAI